VLNILLIAAGLAGFQATLTLPGIAGIILTIGMAVDANVLIFERIREEMNLGKTPRAAVAAGYSRATLTILDANVTTLIAALVLFQFGTGPVKGFAVTLSLGVLASLFTALVLSRLIFDYLLINRKIKNISI
jgi:preprotein translocase subunit SecD